DIVAEHLGMNRVVDQRGDDLSLRANGLDHAHAAVVEIGRVIVVGDLSFGLAGGNPDVGRLKLIEGGIDRLGGPLAHKLHVLQVARVSAPAVGKGVAIGSAVRVRRGNEDVLRGNTAYPGADAVG